MRKTIYHLIQKIIPIDAREKQCIKKTTAWIESGAEIFRIKKPNKPHKHFAAYAFIIDKNLKKILLTDHKTAKRWLPAGGHIEPNEHPQATVKRELAEELNIKTDLICDKPLFLTTTRATQKYHLDVTIWYLFNADSNQPIEYDQKEFKQVQWFTINNIPYSHAEPNIKRFIKKISKQFHLF